MRNKYARSIMREVLCVINKYVRSIMRNKYARSIMREVLCAINMCEVLCAKYYAQ